GAELCPRPVSGLVRAPRCQRSPPVVAAPVVSRPSAPRNAGRSRFKLPELSSNPVADWRGSSSLLLERATRRPVAPVVAEPGLGPELLLDDRPGPGHRIRDLHPARTHCCLAAGRNEGRGSVPLAARRRGSW